jgi:lactoylglutathione lyase
MKAKFTYTGIRVNDLDDSIAFYTKVLGMKEIGRSPVSATTGATASLVSEEGGPVLELNYYPEASPHAAKYIEGSELDHLAFQVEDLDKALSEAKRLGRPTVLEMKTSTSRWAFIRDPNGIYIELFA